MSDTNLVKFGGYSLDAADDEKKDLDASGGADFFKFIVGKNVVRFLPPLVGASSPFVVVHQHFVKMPGGSTSFACPRVMSKGKRPCPMCSLNARLKSSNNPKDRAMADDLYAKRRVYANVLDRRNPEKGIQVASFGKMIHESLNNIRRDEDSGGDFTHPFDGFDIIIERKGTGRTDTAYSTRPARENTPLADSPEEMAALMETAPNIQGFGELLKPEEINEKLAELMPEMFTKQEPAQGRGRGRGQSQGQSRTAQDDIGNEEYVDTESRPSGGDDDIPF